MTDVIIDSQPRMATRVRTRRSPLMLALPYLLIAPTLVLIVLFTIYPSTRTVIDSLYTPGESTRDERGRRVEGESVFVGLDNYIDLFDADHHIGGRFIQTLGNTLIFAASTVVISLPLAFVFALLINRSIRGLALWRFGFFYPVLLPLIGAANIWAFLFANTTGLINTVLGTLGISGQDWIGAPNLVLFSIIIVNVWKQTGFYMIFYLAGLQAIPRDLYEAAELDGANYFQRLFYLTVPLLRGTTLFLMIIATTYSFQTVEQLEALNRGLPADRGNLLLYLIFQNIGSGRNVGYVNAMTVILVTLLLVFTITNFVLFERGRVDE
ncbi:MAG: carbohydrate ABC transporter permease [Chloroflexota bacterium]